MKSVKRNPIMKYFKKSTALVMATALLVPSLSYVNLVDLKAEPVLASAAVSLTDGVTQDSIMTTQNISDELSMEALSAIENSSAIVADTLDLDVLSKAVAEQFNVISNTTAGTGTEQEEDKEEEEQLISPVTAERSSYQFRINKDSKLYQVLDKSVTFYHGADSSGKTSTELEGVYLGDVKLNNTANRGLTLQEVGKVNDPYVILEIAPVSTISELRPHVANAGYYDYSYEELYGGEDINGDYVAPVIALTEPSEDQLGNLSEKTTVRMNLIQILLDKYTFEKLGIDIAVVEDVINYRDKIYPEIKDLPINESKLNKYRDIILGSKITEMEAAALEEKKKNLENAAYELADKIKAEATATADKIKKDAEQKAVDLRTGAATLVATAAEEAQARLTVYENKASAQAAELISNAAKAETEFKEALEAERKKLYDGYDEWVAKYEKENSSNPWYATQAYFVENGYTAWALSDKNAINSETFDRVFYQCKSQAFMKEHYGIDSAFDYSLNFALQFYNKSGYTDISVYSTYTDNELSEKLTENALKILLAADGYNSSNDVLNQYYSEKYGTNASNAESVITTKYYSDNGYDGCYNQWDANATTSNVISKYYAAQGYTDYNDVISKYYYNYDNHHYTGYEDVITTYYREHGNFENLDSVSLTAEEKAAIAAQAEAEIAEQLTAFEEFLNQYNDPNEVNYAKEFHGIKDWADYLKKYEKRLTVADELNKIEDPGSGNYASKVDAVLTRLENEVIKAKVVADKDAYEDLLSQKYDSALEYKRTYMQSAINFPMYNSQQYKYDYDYVRQYALDENGQFITHLDNSKWTYENAYGDSDYAKNVSVAGGYELTTSIYNPLASNESAVYMGSQYDGKLYVHDYTFRKSCLNLAYNRQEASGKVSLTPYIDEYIFAGWMVDADGDGNLESIDTLAQYDTANGNAKLENLDLYTSWLVREYESNVIALKTYSKDSEYEAVDFNGNGQSGVKYTVYVPREIASIQSTPQNYHDAKNQLSICTAVNTTVTFYKNGQYRGYPVNYVDETSAWDFDFDRSTYNTVAKLKQVAPKLMADTDYRVLTYNATLVDKKDAAGNIVKDEDGNNVVAIEYQPYNVQVITITPEELNKMVYYDYAVNSNNPEYYDGNNPVYHESERFTNFINNVDFVLFSGGGSSKYYFEEDGQAQKKFSHNNIHDATEDGTIRQPVLARVPELCDVCDVNDRKILVINPSKVDIAQTFSGSSFDMEWQVAYGIYRRTGDTDQKRRVAVIMNEAFGDQIGGQVPPGSQIVKQNGTENGTKSNLAKLYLMYFAFTDPTKLYSYYVNPDFTVSDGIHTYRFDKMKGTERDEVYKDTWFTGSLYEYTAWNPALFIPFELYDENHWTILTENSENDNFPKYDHTVDTAWIKVNGVTKSTKAIGKKVYDSLGLLAYSVCKNVANEYIYTYNGDTGLYGTFFKHDLINIKNMTNSQPSPSLSGVKGWIGDQNGELVQSASTPYGNRYLAFEYFRDVGRENEIKNGMIATKSAVEFMVQNAQNGNQNQPTKGITILNAEPVKSRYTYNYGEGPVTINVPRVMADDIGVEDVNVNYRYEGYTTKGSVLVAEYYWTYRYKNVDYEVGQTKQDWSLGSVWYMKYTEAEDPADRWNKMPDSSKAANKNNYFNTYLGVDKQTTVTNPDGTTAEGVSHEPSDTAVSPSNVITKYTDSNPVDYFVNMLIKPDIKDSLLNGIYETGTEEGTDTEEDSDTGTDSGTGTGTDTTTTSSYAPVTSVNPTYIIVVKEYASYDDYQNDRQPISIIMHNVTVSRLSLLFNLD